jgi:general secretion pathway protein B
VSFILDALRKSEHERQRSALPGLAQVPLATPPAQLPRWVMIVIGALGAAVLVLGGAWWQSTRAPAPAAGAAVTPATVERSVALPPAAAPRTSPAAPPPPAVEATDDALVPRSLGEAALAAPAAVPLAAPVARPVAPAASPAAANDAPALPSAAALAAEGVALPALRLELHAFSARPSDRFVFINGRRYVEGERLPEGPVLETIEPNGAVLSQYGQRFLLVPE